MEISRQLITFWGVVVVAWSPVARAVDPPEPTPTPQPRTLAALARERPLHRNPDATCGKPIVITDENLAELSRGAVVTELTSTVAEFIPIEGTDDSDPDARDRWRKKVLAQGKVIARLQARRAAVEHKIDRLERGRLDSRTLDRIATAETELREIDLEIGREKSALGRLVRAARKEGAQPGWFR